MVVVFDNQIFSQHIPTFHHLVGVGDALLVQIVATVGGRHLLHRLKHAVLVGEIVVFQLVLRLSQVTDHHRVARIDHIGHPVVHPEGRLERELRARVVLRTETVGHLRDATVERNVGHHVGVVAVEPDHATHIVGQPRTHLASHRKSALLRGDGTFTEKVHTSRVVEVHRQRTNRHPPRTGRHVGGHVQWRVLEMVAHILLQIAQG